MPPACQNIPSPETFAPGMIAYLDCQAQTLGATGYQALAAPGSVASVLLTGMITLLIAVIGYRLLLGYAPTIRDGVLTFVKIGVVIVLATSWPAYQVLIYDVILRSPAEFAASIGGGAGLPGATGGLAARLDGIDQALKTLAIEGVGSPPLGADGTPQMPFVAPPPSVGFDNFALGWSRVGFLAGTLGSFAITRILAGLLLALGPLLAAFLLFDGTRGLFEGWARALIGVALAALAISIVLGVELAFLEPWLATLLARRTAELDILGAPAQLLAATAIFAFALFAIMIAAARVATSLRIPAWGLRGAEARGLAQTQGVNTSASTALGPPIESRSRAAAIADAVAITQHREEVIASTPGSTIGGGSRVAGVGRTGLGTTSAPSASIGRFAPNRRTGTRVSARAAARDRTR